MVTFRPATRDDVPAVVKLLSDDVLGSTRELDSLQPYLDAFDAMEGEVNNTLYVGVEDGEVVATYQLTLITGLSLSATRRAQIEAVRVASHQRGQRVGDMWLNDAETRARDRGARLMQLTTNTTRTRALAFYRSHGYDGTHVGFKKPI